MRRQSEPDPTDNVIRFIGHKKDFNAFFIMNKEYLVGYCDFPKYPNIVKVYLKKGDHKFYVFTKAEFMRNHRR